MSSVLEPRLPDEFLNLPAEKVAEILIANPDKISCIFKYTTTRESLGHVCEYSFTQELLTMLIVSLQKNAWLEEETAQINDDLADCFVGSLNLN